MRKNARVCVTYFGGLNAAWDADAEVILENTFGAAVVSTGSGYDFTSGGRDLNYEIKQGSDVAPAEVRRTLRRFFKNRHARGVKIEIYDDTAN